MGGMTMLLLSFGEIIWDVYPDKETLGGAPLNFAAHAVIQGCPSMLISSIGNDSLGERAIEQMESLGVGANYVFKTDEAPSGVCKVSLDERGVPTYRIDEVSAYDFIKKPEALPHECDLISFGTLALRGEKNRRTLDLILSECSACEVFTDLNIRPPYYSAEVIDFCLSRATVAKLSDEDARCVSEALALEYRDEREFCLALGKKYPKIKLVLMTLGERGSVSYDCRGGEFIFCPAKKTEVVSTVGAGDSFGAAFIVGYMRTADISASMKMASQVSAFVVSSKEAIPKGTPSFAGKFTH